MCIGIPGKIILIKGKKAKIKQGSNFHWVDISSLENKVKKISLDVIKIHAKNLKV